MTVSKPILDACCGSKMFWFDKQNPNVEFCDIREVPLKDVLKAIGAKPLFGHRSGKHNKTHWMCFMKGVS
jgi:hypothetical protein